MRDGRPELRERRWRTAMFDEQEVQSGFSCQTSGNERDGLLRLVQR